MREGGSFAIQKQYSFAETAGQQTATNRQPVGISRAPLIDIERQRTLGNPQPRQQQAGRRGENVVRRLRHQDHAVNIFRRETGMQ